MLDVLITLLILLLLFGIIGYIVDHYMPFDPPTKQLAKFILGVILLLWLLLALAGYTPVWHGRVLR